MTVKLFTSIAGEGISHHAGEVVTLEKDYEERLIKSGQAEKIAEKVAAKKKTTQSKKAK